MKIEYEGRLVRLVLSNYFDFEAFMTEEGHKHEDYPLCGVNSDGENVVIFWVSTPYGDYWQTDTYQHNGYICTHCYWEDGMVEELYSH